MTEYLASHQYARGVVRCWRQAMFDMYLPGGRIVAMRAALSPLILPAYRQLPETPA